ncbi:MAG: phospholipid carrier-dependent glycosyltransferase [Anaerolineae bacterium]|nr:phospholipid carrier-dependent glycosyltransferase [Anaerolineae bacterium]
MSERRLSAALSKVEGLSKGSEAYRNQASDRGNWRWSLGISVALFLLALVPRVMGLDIFITPDERLWIERSVQFLSAISIGDFAGTFQTSHPGVTTKWCGSAGIVAKYLLLRLNPSAGAEASLHADNLGEFLRWLQSDPHNPLEVMVAVRWPIALIVSCSVVGIYFLARELFAERVALLGAILLALEPFYLALSRVLHLDALVTSFMALSILSLAICLKGTRLSPLLVFSGITAGLGVATKVSALFLVPFAGLMALAVYLAKVPGTSERSPTDRYKPLGRQPSNRSSHVSAWHLNAHQWRKALHLAVILAVWAGVMGLTFVLLWPAMWADPSAALRRLLGGSSELAGAGHKQFFLGQVVDDPGPWFFPIVFLFRASPLILLGTVASLPAILPKGTGREGQRLIKSSLFWLWAYACLFVAFITLSPKKLDRYLLPIFPAMTLLAAAGLWELTEVLQQRTLWQRTWGLLRRRVAQPTYLLPLGCLILQAAFLFPHHPYYFTFYNPALGGIRQASRVILVGWEEGLEKVAHYLNEKEGIEDKRVLAWYSALGFNTLFQGESRELDPRRQPADDVWLWYESDYVAFYINQVQRGLPDARTLAFLRSLEPEYTVRLKGLEYAWVYRVPEAVPRDAYPFERVTLVDLDDKVRLLGYDVGEVTVEADGKAYLPLTLYWQNLGPLDANYRQYLKLINGVYHIWGQQEGYPLWDGFMTSTWQEGVVIRDDRQVEILPGTPPGAYQVTISWLEPYSGLSLQPTGGGDLLLGPFDIPPRPPPTIESLGIEHPMTAELDGQVRFLGYNLEGDFRPGDDLHLTLFWQALTEMDENYTVFTHLIDERGDIWGQKDNQPVDGFYPTGGWTAGEIVRDQYDLTISPEAPPGPYRIAVGMYRAETGERLIVEQDGLSPDDQIVLGEFKVRSRE